MDDLLDELFHWYVPEYDYKRPMSEMDKWSIFVNVSVSLALIVGLLLFGLFCKLKHRWLVNAKCAFCNCAARVWRAKLYWWFCNHCQRINGYPKNSSAHADSSWEDIREINEDDRSKLELPNVRNNRVKSPSQRRRIEYSKNDLSASTIISRSPKLFQGEDDDSMQDENNEPVDMDFQKIKNKIKEMLVIGRGIEKLSDDAKDECSGNLRKMHMKLVVDDMNRRFELLSAERALHAKMKQMKEMEKTLRRDRRDFLNETKPSHSIRKRNTFFERTLNHSITPINTLNKEVNLKKGDLSTRLATLETHLTELQDMHAKEIALLQSQIQNKASILKKMEYLKFAMSEYHEKIRDGYDDFNYYQTPSRFNNMENLQFEKPNQILHHIDAESGYLSENGEAKNQLGHTFEVKTDMPVIVEESPDNPEKAQSPDHIKALKRAFDPFKQDNKKSIDEENQSSAGASVAKRRGSGRSARIVKPIRSGQRPTAAAKVVPSSSSSTLQ